MIAVRCDEMSPFARTIMEGKNYAHYLSQQQRHETWPEVAERVSRCVVEPYLGADLTRRIRQLIEEKKFMPGGRYLYAAGRAYPQVNSCFAGETSIITRNGVFSLRELVGCSVEVLNRFGEWERAEVRSFGVQRLHKVKFTNGDEVLATADHRWWQLDGTRVTTLELKRVPLTRPAVAPSLDEEAIRHGIVLGDGNLCNHGRYSEVKFHTLEKEALVDHFNDEERSITVGGGAVLKFRTVRRKTLGLGVHLQPSRYKVLPNARCCTPEYARGFIAGLIATDGSTRTSSVTISCSGRKRAERIRELAILGGCVVMGVSLQKAGVPNSVGGRLIIGNDDMYVVRIKPFSAPIIRQDQLADLSSRRLTPRKMWLDVESVEATDRTEEVYCCVVPGSESFTLANGAITSNCFLFRAHDSREGWADIWYKCGHSLMTGGGVGVVYSDLREEGALVHGLGGRSTGPIALARTVNEQGRYIRQGGSRRSAIWAGLLWKHKDIFKFISVKDWDDYTREGKRRDFNFPAPMDTTNISVILDDEFFEAYYDETHPLHFLAADVYWAVIRHMLMTGEPGFSVDIGTNSGENLRNACLAGDTLIAVADGRGAVPIKDLVGTSTPVYSSDENGHIKVGTLRNVRITRRNAELMRITTSDGGSFRVTPDHKVMLANGTFVEAISLRLGTSLAAYRSGKATVGEQVVTELGGGSWEDVYDGTVDELHCFAAVTTENPDLNAGEFAGVIVHNCTEVTSRDDEDMCNLGSLNLSRFDNLDDFTEAVELTTAFLLCGSIYSRLPIPSMDAVRTKNRRLGLGLMGCHEWMLKRGYRYGEVDELAAWMRSYTMSGAFANRWADKLGISRPVATRSIAPTGTISIVAETTSGVEPIFATALKRRYLDGNTWKAQYIVDPTARRLIASGVDPALIEDSLTLAEDVERRIAFQSWLQTKVDHGISSTLNIPPWGSSINNEGTVTRFGTTLLKYLPQLRGITAYPDGARDGQPLVKVPYHEAIGKEGVIFEDSSEANCPSGVCGI